MTILEYIQCQPPLYDNISTENRPNGSPSRFASAQARLAKEAARLAKEAAREAKEERLAKEAAREARERKEEREAARARAKRKEEREAAREKEVLRHAPNLSDAVPPNLAGKQDPERPKDLEAE